jgi:outer membrane immunogenic protein
MLMKNTTIAAALALVIGGAVTAQAADLDRAFKPAAPILQAPSVQAGIRGFDWTGAYIGGSVGYGWGDQDWRTSGVNGGSAFTQNDSFSTKGMLYGIQIGANKHFNNNVVAGVEADIAYADVKGTFGDNGAANTKFVGANGDGGTYAGTQYDGIATVRGRIGYAFDRILPYATAGLAVGHSHAHINNLYSSADYSSGSDFSVGWTAGAGVEYAMTDNLSVKAEYLYTNFPNANYWMTLPAAGSSANIRDDAQLHTMKLGVNWKFQ